MTTKAIKEDGSAEVILGEKPFVHPGNLSATEFSKYLRDIAGQISRIAELQVDSARYQQAAPIAQRRFEVAKDELLEAAGLLSQAATLFPEIPEESLQWAYQESRNSPAPAPRQDLLDDSLCRHEEQKKSAQPSASQ
ncbi:hypothetical protein NUH87_26680 [Pseudomonas batumici]